MHPVGLNMPKDRKEDLSESDIDAMPETDAVMPLDQDEPTKGAKKIGTEWVMRLRRLSDQLTAFLASRQPRLWVTLWAMSGVIILLGLGTWQVMRGEEKNTLIAHVEQELASTPYDLSVKMPQTPEEWAEMHYKPVRMTGVWMPLRVFRLAPRSFAGQTGYQWIIPFRLENGQVILVNRGFVPDNMSLVPPHDGEIHTVHGVAYMPKTEKPRFVPENRPAKGEWVWLDIVAMAHEVGVKETAPVVVYENRISDKNSYPIGGQVPLPFHNRHRQYAVTWYCLALALMGVWIMASGKKTKKPEDDVQNTSVEAMDPVARRGLYPEATD